MGTGKKVYSFQTWNRLELPIDWSKKQLADTMLYSCHQIDNALIALDGENADTLNSCYAKLVRGRKAGMIPEERGHGQRDTTTFAFYWEIIELVDALATAKNKNNRTTGNDLARCTFEELADRLTEALAASVPLSFAQSKMLADSSIQNEINRKFVSEAGKRLAAVQYIVEHDPTAKQILAVCEKLDALLMEWIYGKSFNYYKNKQITVKSLESLYDSLMEVRMNSYAANGLKGPAALRSIDPLTPPKIEFEASADIIAALQTALPEGTKRIKDKQRLNELCRIYEQYLTFNVEEEEKEAVSASIKEYLGLKNYITNASKTEEDLESAIRKDLVQFVKDQFFELQRLDYIPFPYSNFEASSLQADFLKERIKNVQAKIMCEFYEPFRLLRIFYSIRNFTCFSDAALGHMNDILKNSPPFHQLVLQMEQAILQLSKDNPHLPQAKVLQSSPDMEQFSDYFSRIPKEEFLQTYKKTVVPVFPEKPEIMDSVLESLNTGSYLDSALSEAMAVSLLLFWSCQIAMLDSVPRWTDLLKKDYINLTNFYSGFDKFNDVK